MDSELAIGIAGVAIFALGIVGGFALGDRIAAELVTRRQYLIANVAVIVCGIVLAALVQAFAPMLVQAGVVGLIGGAVAGLKFGFGESVGLWQVHDEVFQVNKEHLETAESGKGEERRRRRKSGGEEPELMSVASDGPREERR